MNPAKRVKRAKNTMVTVKNKGGEIGLTYDGWHLLEKKPKDLPEPGERVLICIGYALVGEGWLNCDGKWHRYCDLGPVDEYMHDKVVAWKEMDKPPKKPEKKNVTVRTVKPMDTAQLDKILRGGSETL